MAKIPVRRNSNSVSRGGPGTPSLGVDAAALQGRATAELGQSIARAGQQIGGKLKNLEQKRREAEIKEFGDEKSFEFRRRLNKFQIEKEAEMEGTDHKGLAAQTDEFIREQKRELLGDDVEADKAEYFEASVSNTQQKALLGADTTEHTQRAEYYMDNRLKRVEELGVMAFEDPDPFKVSQEILIQDQQLTDQVGLNFTGGQVDSLKTTAREKARESVIQGQIRDGLPGLINPSMTEKEANDAISRFLSGENPGTSPLMQGMEADERILQEKRLKAAYVNQRKAKVAGLKRKARSSVIALERLDTLDPLIQNEVLNTKLEIDRLPEGEDKTEMLAQIETAELVSEFNRSTPNISNQQLQTTDLDKVLPLTGLDTIDLDTRARDSIRKSIARTIGERNEDGAAYVQKHYPNLYGDPADSLEQQRELGITNPRVISKNEAQTKSAAILEETSPRMKVREINGIMEEFGPEHGHAVLAEMAESNKDFDRSYLYASYFGNPATQEKVIRAISDPNLKKGFDDAFGASKRRTLESSVRQELTPTLRAFHKAGMSEFADNFSTMVTKTALYNELQGKEGSARGTAREIVENNFHVIDKENGSMILPKTMKVNKASIESFIDESFNQRDFLKQSGLDITRFTASTGQTEDEFFEVFEERSFWSTSNTGDGVFLMAEDPRTGLAGPVKGSNGSPIEIKFTVIEDLPFVRGR